MESRIPEVYNECVLNREEAINILNDKIVNYNEQYILFRSCRNDFTR